MSDVVTVGRFVVASPGAFRERLEESGWHSIDELLGGGRGDSEAVGRAGDERGSGVSEDTQRRSGDVSRGGGKR